MLPALPPLLLPEEPFMVKLTPAGQECVTARQFLDTLSAGENAVHLSRTQKAGAGSIRKHEVRAAFTVQLAGLEGSLCKPDREEKAERSRRYTHYAAWVPWPTGLIDAPAYPLMAHELRITSEGPTWRFAARFGACASGGMAGWTAAPRVLLPWDQLVFLEQFRGEEVLQAVDRAAVLEVAQEMDILGIAGAPSAQELVAALQLTELGRLKAYPVPRTSGRAGVDAALRALAALFAKPSSRSDLAYYRSDFRAQVLVALDALRKLPDDRDPDLQADLIFRMRESLPSESPLRVVRQVQQALDALEAKLALLA